MKTNHKMVVLICNQKELLRKVHCLLDELYDIVEKSFIKSLNHLLRLQSVYCILLYIGEESVVEEIYLNKFKKSFPLVPLLAITNHNSLELARKCGKLGIDRIVHVSDLENLESEIALLCSQKNIFVSLNDLGIGIGTERGSFSELLKETLEIIENNYITLISISQIAEMMDVSECTLSREFQKYSLPGPKRMLMYLKVYHSSLLMQNNGLNIREIASLSGFSNDKRMAECFQRVYNMPPGEYRKQMNKKNMIEHVENINHDQILMQ